MPGRTRETETILGYRELKGREYARMPTAAQAWVRNKPRRVGSSAPTGLDRPRGSSQGHPCPCICRPEAFGVNEVHNGLSNSLRGRKDIERKPTWQNGIIAE